MSIEEDRAAAHDRIVAKMEAEVEEAQGTIEDLQRELAEYRGDVRRAALRHRVEKAKRPLDFDPKYAGAAGPFQVWLEPTPFDKIEVRGIPENAINYRLKLRFNVGDPSELIKISILYPDRRAVEYLCSAYNLDRTVWIVPSLKDILKANL